MICMLIVMFMVNCFSVTINAAQETTSYVTLTYDANGGIGAPDSQRVEKGSVVWITKTEPIRDGYIFKGWATSPISNKVEYKARVIGRSCYSGRESITLYAVWVKGYTIKYIANGGQYAPDEQIKGHGEKLYLSSEIPERAGYIFKGWGLSPDSDEVLYNKRSLYTDNASITLYAIWKKKETITDTSIIPTEIPTNEPNKEYSIGDVNNDGTVNLSDAQMTLKAALGIIQLDEYSKKAADVDGKEGVSLSDA